MRARPSAGIAAPPGTAIRTGKTDLLPWELLAWPSRTQETRQILSWDDGDSDGDRQERRNENAEANPCVRSLTWVASPVEQQLRAGRGGLCSPGYPGAGLTASAPQRSIQGHVCPAPQEGSGLTSNTYREKQVTSGSTF